MISVFSWLELCTRSSHLAEGDSVSWVSGIGGGDGGGGRRRFAFLCFFSASGYLPVEAEKRRWRFAEKLVFVKLLAPPILLTW